MTVEEGSIGGFSTQVLQVLVADGKLDRGIGFRSMFMPDEFLDHDTPQRQVIQAGLDASSIVGTVKATLQGGAIKKATRRTRSPSRSS